MKKESSGAARVADWAWAVAKLHHEFSWAWPGVGERAGSGLVGSGWEAGKLVADHLAQIYIDAGTPAREKGYSGYLSQPARPDAQSHTSLLTVDAMLCIKDGGASESCPSDCEELGSPECGTRLEAGPWAVSGSYT